MKGRFRLLFTFRSCDERRLPFAPVALLSLRAERRKIPPRQWGYTWGYFCPRSYGNAVIPGPFAPVSTPTSGTINFSSIAARRTSAFRAAQCGTQRIARDSAPSKRTFRDQLIGGTVCVPGSV